MTSTMVLLAYQERIDQFQSVLAQVQIRQGIAITVLVLALAVAATLSFLAFSRRMIAVWYPLLPLPVAVLSLQDYRRRRSQTVRMLRLLRFYTQGVERLEERWAGKGISGEEFEVPDHPYATDLNLFGAGSLFERLCTARTHLGRERLARYLQEPAAIDEIHRRQAAVRELSERIDLRERVALLGRYDFEESRWETFAEWLDSPSSKLVRWLRPTALASSVMLGALSLAVMLVPSRWPLLGPLILPIVGTNAIVSLWLRKKVRHVIQAAIPVANEIALIQEGLELLAAQQFIEPKLAGLASRAGLATPAIRRLRPWLTVLQERTKDWFYLPSLWLLLGTQSALAIESWRRCHGGALRQGLDAWAEFEALSAVACYAYENPENSWPEIEEGGALFRAEGLGNPLMTRSACVVNVVSLGEASRFCILSGSNMSGKSTLLRSIGLAAVLAFAGASVRARSLRLNAMRVCASVALVDSLHEGKSKFLAEVRRLRDMLQLSLTHPVLFLVDEIFSGTNSRDRRTAAEAVVRALAGRGAIGVISTHDIALTAIATHGGVNLHMASREGADSPLDFDYRLKPGVNTESNALAIVRMVGVPI